MASPMRRSGSTIFQFRKRIPTDLLSKARGTALAIPLGDQFHEMVITAKATHVIFPLRTRDPREAKERKAVALAYLDAVWKSLNEGPMQLTHKQILALAGEVYRELIAQFEDNPGRIETWKQLVQLNMSGMGGDASMSAPRRKPWSFCRIIWDAL